MAYNAANEESTVLATIDKNDKGEKYMVKHIKNKISGSENIDIRVMYTPDGGGELMPSKKGVRFSADNIFDIFEPLLKYMTKDEREAIIDNIRAID
jgi:hypothetical protein